MESKNKKDKKTIYQMLVNQLKKDFGDHLRTVVLLGSRARGKTTEDKDHDTFLLRLTGSRFTVSDLAYRKTG